jgi:hypothetical protein
MLDTLSNKQALADGVLELRGNLESIKLRSGRQAFLAKLQQMIMVGPDADDQAKAARKPQPPADRALGFAREAHQGINGALLRCEERYPREGEHSVLYVVVERDANQWRERLVTLHDRYFGPGQSDPLAPVRLEVIDRATDEALQRLIDAGLVAKTTRATRPLFPAEESSAPPPPLSDAERERVAAFRQQASRKLKMARLLADGELADEARAALLEALLPLGRALAIESRLPEPATIEDALLAPLSLCWKDALPIVRAFVADPTQACVPVVTSLDQV